MCADIDPSEFYVSSLEINNLKTSRVVVVVVWSRPRANRLTGRWESLSCARQRLSREQPFQVLRSTKSVGSLRPRDWSVRPSWLSWEEEVMGDFA